MVSPLLRYRESLRLGSSGEAAAAMNVFGMHVMSRIDVLFPQSLWAYCRCHTSTLSTSQVAASSAGVSMLRFLVPPNRPVCLSCILS